MPVPSAPACGHCGGINLTLKWQTFDNGTKHIRANCAKCSAYVTYVPQTTENLALVEKASAPDGQMSLFPSK